MSQQFGIVGLGVMGQNLALNIERNGFAVVGYDRDPQKVEAVKARVAGKNIQAFANCAEFIAALNPPRSILLMVPAGEATEAAINELLPYLVPGDVLIDGGNSHFQDTIRRGKELSARGIRFIGTGISGGEEGALKGPCIMPGGDVEAYRLVEPIFTKIAAKVDGEPCCAYMGTGGAGHFVKTTHNGIEYGIMQLICEIYDFFRRGLGLSTPQVREIFNEWAQAELGSFLLEISALVLGKIDPETGQPLVDLVLDTAGQKGTGKWTAQTALDLGVPVPTLAAAVEARILSGLKKERVAASKILPGPTGPLAGERDELIAAARKAFYLGMLACYAQGMALMREADKEYGFGLNYEAIARIWRGGCIIRARMLEEIRKAFGREPELVNLLLAPEFAAAVRDGQAALRKFVGAAQEAGVPVICSAATLAYYDSYRSERLPANLLQAQRDHFGAHTYRRIDKEGVFHTNWAE
ncbi:MAG: NADP-dependent phosphogluconate dehydrogenase [Bacillota bacterium]